MCCTLIPRFTSFDQPSHPSNSSSCSRLAMRVCCVVLVATAILLTSIGDVLAATETEQSQLSKMAAQTKHTRFLRRDKVEDEVNEERAPLITKSSDLYSLLTHLKGKNNLEAFALLQFMKVPQAQREAILLAHAEKLAQAAKNI
ncbi:uncharacterized protein KRP23_14148 [Phytophthora ramorum]|uniref:uncharacterized protein n=1 Tax=Phytophthora ramorum TaxID=164328 RepID=UPI00309AA6A0|nr:hypothetical protein KRP23_14148 [Phytophthora ramorum]